MFCENNLCIVKEEDTKHHGNNIGDVLLYDRLSLCGNRYR